MVTVSVSVRPLSAMAIIGPVAVVQLPASNVSEYSTEEVNPAVAASFSLVNTNTRFSPSGESWAVGRLDDAPLEGSAFRTYSTIFASPSESASAVGVFFNGSVMEVNESIQVW